MYVNKFLRRIICCRQLGFPTTLPTTLNLTPTAHKERCMKMEFFVDKQKEFCAKYDKILPVSMLLLHSKRSSS